MALSNFVPYIHTEFLCNLLLHEAKFVTFLQNLLICCKKCGFCVTRIPLKTKKLSLVLQMESGGTVLSTNWSDVGKRKVEVNPPDDMEWKKF